MEVGVTLDNLVRLYSRNIFLFQIFYIPGYKDVLTLLTTTRPERSRWWLRESVFWVFTLFLLTWPYRIFFLRRSASVHIVFIKEFRV